MFGFKISKYMETRRLIGEIERIQRRYPGHHLSPKKIASAISSVINITDESNWSTLHYSAYLGMEETCLELLTNGADLNLKNAWGETPLHLACRMSNFSCIEIILQFKPDMNIQNVMLYTPLSLFVSRPPQNEYILDTLLDAGANPDIPDEDGNSPLHILAKQVETEKTNKFARLLIKYKANVDSENNFKKTPLHFAVDDGKVGLVGILLKSGASVNIPDVSGKTAMDKALEKKTLFPKVFECLGAHLIMQYCCGISVNLEHLQEVLCNSEQCQDFKKSCEEEVNLLKSTRAGESTVTYYDILVSSTHRLARSLFNSDILDSLVEFNMESSIVGSIFGSFLLKKRRAALKRYHEIKFGIVPTRKVFHFLPHVFIDKLMEYLDIDDFINLDAACSFRT
ncbi:hypothetical protein WA026_006318 [Henosepilachna vigintioctopunctata]|uniref:Uncharacterized protein n=1 Tax=Henosepilachna vigintioctopunctata TaxID=420089 RepID=A0AAW1TK94_9CUCU